MSYRVRGGAPVTSKVAESVNLILQGKPLSTDTHRVERTLFQATIIPAKDLTPLTAAGVPEAQEINDALVKRGLQQSGPPPVCNVASSLIMAKPLLVVRCRSGVRIRKAVRIRL